MYREHAIKGILADKRIMIAGNGREGRSVLALLQQLFPGRSFPVVEGNEAIIEEVEKNSYDLIVKSPGIPTFVFDGHCDRSRLTSLTDIFLQVYGDQVIGVSGTKGKSTTTSLIYHILHHYRDDVLLGGNIGIPLFELLPQMNEHSLVVAELSCHQLDGIRRAPHIGLLLNLYQEHLDHYGSYNDYKLAKMQMALKQGKDDYFVYCAEKGDLVEMVSLNSPLIVAQCLPYALSDKPDDFATGLPLLGDHNRSNVLAALKVVGLCGVGEKEALEAAASFKGLEHRLELVGEYGGITFYNDSISTIPAACIAAVGALPRVDTLILGGFDRGIDYTDLVNFLASAKGIKNLAIVGAAGKRILEALKSLGAVSDRNILQENDYSLIVDWCKRVTPQGGICLLSPAAASYDQFKNFEERGRIYKDLVRK
ncbi:MAG: UDP-N-acetylmuramoyl-L-alanine--D-glutamate ligase [Bacteroidales bacterium]|nr:UDP-N-acetylmuramoyl-L-alanine--D-glutamate ligase [Bacteroidales bacterium]